MSKFLPDQIRSIHLELTTRCNALCPMCARTGKGAARPNLALAELSIDDIRTIFPEAALVAIDNIDLCGAFGEPLLTRDLDKILVYLRKASNCAVDIYTNGSLRPSWWWKDLPDMLGRQSKVCFGIDGLADTNNLYRVGTSFPTILRNAAAFISRGGRAQWDFLVFKHNQHQVDAARRLSEDMGFENFSVKVSGRFFRHFNEEAPDIGQDHSPDAFPVFGRDGTYGYDLELPDHPTYRNRSNVRIQELFAKDESLLNSFDRSKIRCLSIHRGSIFVSVEGTVFPCCWTYIASRNGSVFGMTKVENLQIGRLLDAHGGPDAINAKAHTLQKIVAGPFFEALSKSWNSSSLVEGKPKICAQTCGGCFSPKDAYADPSLSPYKAPVSAVPH